MAKHYRLKADGFHVQAHFNDARLTGPVTFWTARPLLFSVYLVLTYLSLFIGFVFEGPLGAGVSAIFTIGLFFLGPMASGRIRRNVTR